MTKKQDDLDESFPAWEETPKTAMNNNNNKNIFDLMKEWRANSDFRQIVYVEGSDLFDAILELNQRLANLEKLTKCVITLEELNEGDKK